MIRVLIIAATRPARPAVLAQALQKLAGLGAAGTLVAGADDLTVPAGTVALAVLPAVPPARGLTPGEQLWRRARRHSVTRRAAARADVIIALDPAAVHVAWQLGLRHRGADVVLGLTPGLRQVEIRRSGRGRRIAPGPDPRLIRLVVGEQAARYGRAARRRMARAGRRAIGAAVGVRVHRTGLGRTAWRLTLRYAPAPTRVRIALARRIADSLTRAGFPGQAAALVRGTANRLGRPRLRARLLGTAADQELNAGRIPSYLGEAAAATLEVADAAYSRGDWPAAAAAARRAADLLFHRGVHFDSVTSPATADPAAFVAPWLTSTVGRALAAPRGRTSAPAAHPRRVLFLYETNANFLGLIRDHFAANAGLEVRQLDLAADPELSPLLRDPTRHIELRLAASAELDGLIERRLRPHLDWADVVFVDWCKASSALLTRIDPGAARVAVRLHSFEVFTAWPYLVDWSRVDDLIFVSDHLREFTRAAVPALAGPGGPRLSVLPNAMDLRRYERPKSADARFTLGLVGISAVAKDPRWAIEVLRELRRQDPRYRLLLIGADLRGKISAAATRYERAYRRDLAELEPSGAIRRYGATDDVPAALTPVGTILSSSVRESFHCGLFEGIASHAVPVVRDWPFFPGAARELVPADWVVATPAEAAARIRAVTATEPEWRRLGAEAAGYVLSRWDFSVTAHEYDDLLLGQVISRA